MHETLVFVEDMRDCNQEPDNAGHTRNQQTEALIEALELEYTFDGPGGGDTINQYSKLVV